MHISTHLDRDVVAIEADDEVTVMVDLTAPAVAAGLHRPAQGVVVVLDRSGSMTGSRLTAAQGAVLELVARLADTDSFALVAFDREARAVVPAGRVGELGRAAIRAAVAGVATGRSTDLSSGYVRGVQEGRRMACPGGVTLIVLSDGHANGGQQDPQEYRELAVGVARAGITTGTIGIGVGYDELILSELAVGGGGNHTFAVDGDAAAAALAGEVEGLLSKTVQAATLLIEPGAAAGSVGVLTDLPTVSAPEGMLVELGDCYAGEQRRVLIRIEVPAMSGLGLVQVARLRLAYVGLPNLESHSVTVPVSVNVVPGDEAAGRVPDPGVEREKLILTVQRARAASEQALRAGDPDSAAGLIDGTIRDLEARADGSVDIQAELASLRAAAAELAQAGPDLLAESQGAVTKRLTSDRVKRSRGYRSRTQGGASDGTG